MKTDEVELESLVVKLDVADLFDDLFGESLFTGDSWVLHHCQDGVVILLVLILKQDKLGQQVSSLGSSEDIWKIDTRPEELLGGLKVCRRGFEQIEEFLDDGFFRV